MAPNQLIFGTTYNLLVEIAQKALWLLKKLNLSSKDANDMRLDLLNDTDDSKFVLMREMIYIRR